jgi:hypothetical protein
LSAARDISGGDGGGGGSGDGTASSGITLKDLWGVSRVVTRAALGAVEMQKRRWPG